MSAKKAKWSPIKEMLFTYLAITKILYYFNTVTAMEHRGLGNILETLLMRLNQDALIIIGVVLFFYLDKFIQLKKSKYSKVLENIVFYAVGFVALMGVTLIYIGIMVLIFGSDYIQIDSWGAFIGYAVAGYIVVAVVLNLKYYFKEKAKPDYVPAIQSTGDKLAMLEILRDDGILTQAEFDSKREMLHI